MNMRNCRTDWTAFGLEPGPVIPSRADEMKRVPEQVKLVGAGIDTLIINVRYADKDEQPIQKLLADDLAQELDSLQQAARSSETAVASPWAFENVLLFIEPHGAGRQWRWLLTSRLLNLTISRGKFNDVIAQVRFASEYLWSKPWAGDAIVQVHEFLTTIFGDDLHLQVSEVHLCADVTGYDFSLANYEQHFISKARKQSVIYGVDSVALDGRTVSTLQFSGHGSPLSCSMYNKTREIQQKSGKTWFHDLWKSHGWEGSSEVWRVEFRYKRDFLHNLNTPIESPYTLLTQLQILWEYATGHVQGGDDGYPDGWLRYVVPTDDNTNSRWPVHPAWRVIQVAFHDLPESLLGALVRQRIREKNVERGVAAMVGYASTLAAWLGDAYATPETDMSLTLQWLYQAGMTYLEEKQRSFSKEVQKKQERYGTTDGKREHDEA